MVNKDVYNSNPTLLFVTLRLQTLYLRTFVFCLLFVLYVWPAFCHSIIKRILIDCLH